MKLNKYDVAYFIEKDNGYRKKVNCVDGMQRMINTWNGFWFSFPLEFCTEQDIIDYFRRKINKYRLEVVYNGKICGEQ